MRVSIQPTYILHSRPYRETSLLVEAWSLDHGRIGLIAKGARRAKSSLRGVLQPFQPLLLSWSGKQELMTLTNAENDGPSQPLAPRVLPSGFYVNELLMRLLHRNDPHPELYRSYVAVLAGLRDAQSPEPTLRVFEKRLLDALGYGMLLDREAVTDGPIKSDQHYRYFVERGPIPISGEQNGDVNTAIHGETLLAISRESLETSRVLREAKSLMRHILRYYLGDKPLESRKLFG